MQPDAQEAPPAYTEYPTELPEQFPIGGRQLPPLVNVTELQDHLRLLGALHKLKYSVQSQEEGIASTNRDLAWVVFVSRAVYRFYVWTSSHWKLQEPGLNEAVMPPLDIIMVWHTYLLVRYFASSHAVSDAWGQNPRAFFEDSRRMNSVYNLNLVSIEYVSTVLQFLL